MIEGNVELDGCAQGESIFEVRALKIAKLERATESRQG
jgi:hypothetical protein